MKHCTSIEQSKRLLELGLSPETADMVYIMFDGKPLNGDAELNTVFESKDNKWYWIDFIDGSWNVCEEDVVCWSLAALLSVMPSASLVSSDDHHYRLYCMERFTEWYDNAIDACVDMIEKLHEQNSL